MPLCVDNLAIHVEKCRFLKVQALNDDVEKDKLRGYEKHKLTTIYIRNYAILRLKWLFQNENIPIPVQASVARMTA